MNKKPQGWHIIVILIFCTASFIFLTKSPLHPWIGGNAGVDSSVFQTIALMMEKGYMPYRDSFDHKGPLIYLINYVGRMIAPYRGVWVIEYFSLVFTMIFMYKTARIWVTRTSLALICVFTSLSLLFQYFDGGNLVEEYALPFIAMGLWIFLDYLVSGRLSRKRLIASGCAFGCICFLRLNMAALWLVFCSSILCINLGNRKFASIGKMVTWFGVGVGVLAVPIIIWLWTNNNLVQFCRDYFGFNWIYSSAEGGRALFPAKWSAFFHFSNTVVFSITLITTIYLLFSTEQKGRRVYLIYFIYIVCNQIFISISGMTYPHYGMILVPLAVAPLASLFARLEDRSDGVNTGSFLLAGFLLCILVIGDWETTLFGAGRIFSERKESHITKETQTICKMIEMNSASDDEISVYGNANLYYVLSGRSHATRYSYLTPIGSVYPPIMDDYFKQLSEKHPKIIIIPPNRNDSRIAAFIEDNNYSQIWPDNSSSSASTMVFVS